MQILNTTTKYRRPIPRGTMTYFPCPPYCILYWIFSRIFFSGRCFPGFILPFCKTLPGFFFFSLFCVTQKVTLHFWCRHRRVHWISPEREREKERERVIVCVCVCVCVWCVCVCVWCVCGCVCVMCVCVMCVCDVCVCVWCVGVCFSLLNILGGLRG